MGTRFWLVVAILLVGLVSGTSAWSLLKSTPSLDGLVTGALPATHSSRPAIGDVDAGQSGESSAGFPMAVVDHSEYDFGIMDPAETATHAFVIRNAGNAPLELEAGPTTCKCTLSDLAQPVILPNEEGVVNVEWTTVNQPVTFVQSAKVLTNDPINPTIRLVIRGKILTQIGLDPPSLVFPQVSPDQTTNGSALIYSQVWDEFFIDRIESSLDGLTWQLEPATRPSLISQRAKAGYDLHITLPADMAQGNFSHWMRIEVRPSDNSAAGPLTYEFALVGNVLRRLCIYGHGIDATGVVYVGPVREGQGARLHLLMKVRDPERDLAIESIETSPKFLEASISPHVTSRKNLGLYDLEIVLPADAPRCLYMRSPAGQVRITTGHPRIPELTLPVQFAVLGE
jgi:hypothetical protein